MSVNLTGGKRKLVGTSDHIRDVELAPSKENSDQIQKYAMLNPDEGGFGADVRFEMRNIIISIYNEFYTSLSDSLEHSEFLDYSIST